MGDVLTRIADGRTDLVVDHVERGGAAEAEAGGVPLIRWCAYYGDVSAIRFLLAEGAALEDLGPNLDLNGAVFHGHWQLSQFLVERGADVNRPLPDTGETPLHAALCHRGRPRHNRVMRILLASGADPNRATRPGVATGSFMRDVRTKGETPLHRAAIFGDEEAIRMLLEAGARVDACDVNGESPLAWASWAGRPAYILELLCYGEHRVHPEAVARSRNDPRMGWESGMAVNLLGTPHIDRESSG